VFQKSAIGAGSTDSGETKEDGEGREHLLLFKV
jgi:hypothetical protein